MKKRIIGFCTVLIALLMSQSLLAQGINFESGTWAEAKAKAKAENKFIFMDAYTTWCGPCKWMSANTFTDEGVGGLFNDKYVSIKMDMEKGEGVELAEEYQVRAYPTLLFFSSDGEIVHKIVGALDGKKFMLIGREAMNPQKQVYTMKKAFENGDREEAFLYEFSLAASAAYLNAKDATVAYFETQSEEQLLSERNWHFIERLVSDMDDPKFEFVVSHMKDYEKVAEEGSVKAFVERAVGGQIRTVTRSQDESKLKEFAVKVKEIAPNLAPELIAKANYIFYSRSEDLDKAHATATNYFDNFCDNTYEFNNIAWDYFENFDDEEMLMKAIQWVDRSIELDKNVFNLDTKANLLFKVGKIEEARAIAIEAIDLGERAGDDTKETEDLLKKINL